MVKTRHQWRRKRNPGGRRKYHEYHAYDECDEADRKS